MRLTSIGLVACIALAGCATSPKDIAPAYVSTTGYAALSCEQLRVEAEHVSARAAIAAGEQSKKATGDAVAVGVSLIVFWPAIFFMKGDGAQAAEVSRLKGEMEAIHTVNRQKNCGIQFSAG